LLILFEYLIVTLDKISNKKNSFKNDEGYYIQVHVEKRMIRFKLMIFELEKRDQEII